LPQPSVPDPRGSSSAQAVVAPNHGAATALPELPPFSLDLSSDCIARFLVARDGVLPSRQPASGDPVPVAALSFLRVQPARCVSVHRLLERDPDRGMFGGVTYHVDGPLYVGQVIAAQSIVTERQQVPSPRGVLTLTTMETMWSAGESVAVVERVRMVDLPPDSGPPADGPEDDGTIPAVMRLPGFSRVQVAWMCVECGDLNPLHLDQDYARRRGFFDVVVPGPSVVAAVERDLSTFAGCLLSAVQVRLRAPVFPGQDLDLCVAEEKGQWRFRLVGEGKVKADGWATLAT